MLKLSMQGITRMPRRSAVARTWSKRQVLAGSMASQPEAAVFIPKVTQNGESQTRTKLQPFAA